MHSKYKTGVGDGGEYEPATKIYIDDDLGNCVADCFRPYSLSIGIKEMEANADRFSACWNALQKFRTDEIIAMTENGVWDNLHKERNRND